MSLSPETKDHISVQVAYALPDKQYLWTLDINRNSTVMDAIKQSGLLAQFTELAESSLTLGIFGKIVSRDAKLEEGMRIEIYRPLIIDPKESRRKRALLAKK